MHPPAAAGTEFDRLSWGVRSDTLRGVVDGVRAPLSRAFVVPGSEVVRVGVSILDPGDYSIDYYLGTIRINVAIPPGAEVIVTYRRQPFTLKPMYSLRPVVAAVTEDRVLPPERAADVRERGRSPGGLVFGGSKSVSFTVGSNRGTKLDQTLQATIEGQLTPTIKVRALLSDSNLPIQPEGNTEELEYFDKVFIEIEGTRASATLGDFSFDSHVSSFSPMVRQVKGVMGSAWWDGGIVRAAGAVSKGVFRSKTFRGTSGLQGPYELLSAGRNTGEVIVAGTEKVHVDGSIMTRGQNQDYIIDYDRGTLTFTPRRLITSDSEIGVDFEVTQERYSRSAVVGTAEKIALGNGVEMHVQFARERDDRDRPVNEQLSAEDIAALAAAGDNADRAITGGVTPAAAGQGEYYLIPADSVGPDRYAFNDTSGTLLVSFVEVAASAGDYVLGGISSRGRPVYEYVGPGLGNYEVGRQLALPEEHQVLTARVNRVSGRGVTFDAEWNLSELDNNLFSSLDDDDNRGDAGRAVVSLKDIPVGIGSLAVTGLFSTLEERFKSFDRVRPQFFYRDWNLENVPLVGREYTSEVTTEFTRARRVKLAYSLGRLERDEFAGTRHEGRATLGSVAERGIDVRMFSTETIGSEERRERRHLYSQGALALWAVVPFATLAQERYREFRTERADSGRAYRLQGVGLRSRGERDLTFTLEGTRRDTEEIEASAESWIDARRDLTLSAAIIARRFETVQGELRLTHRDEDNLIVGGTTTNDIGLLKTTMRSSRTGIRSDVDYEISQNAARSLKRSVVFLGDGKGDYNSLGEQVGKGKGDYTVVYIPTTSVVPTRRADLSFRLRWSAPRSGAAGSGWWNWVRANVTLDQTVAIKEETTFDPGWKVYLLFPSALQREDGTLLGTTLIRQDWSLLEGTKNISLTYRYQREDTEDNRFEGINENRLFGEHALRVSRSVSGSLTLNAEVARTLRQRSGKGIDLLAGSSYDARSWRLITGAGVRFAGGSSLDFDATTTIQSDDVSGADQKIVSLRPRLVWKLARTVSVFGFYDFAFVSENVGMTRPIIFANEGGSHRWSVAPTVRFSRTISVVTTYQGRHETTFSGARITEHELRIETRAFF